ncbi:MAG: hypothetical protein LT071_12410 [Nocardioides sp.]|nr:hypothetical protein [Nocardioides sp.]
MRLRGLVTAVLVAALAAGCSPTGSPDEPADPDDTSTSPVEPGTSVSTDLVPGSGAELFPDEGEPWCRAITEAQLEKATGHEVVEVRWNGGGLQQCSAVLTGAELDIAWGNERTSGTAEDYVGRWSRPPGRYEISSRTLDNGQAVLLVKQADPLVVTAAVVLDSRLYEATVVQVADRSTEFEDLADLAVDVLAVYVG